mmetsp:Transcript_6204/g.21997  ORF Transcript_6204/g.21997 Transcript_6204/m.21997 type:complete len:398 (-) Transcript_6204:1045-2238(-)
MASVLKKQTFSKEQRQKRNYLIHWLYIRKEYDECLELIDDTLKKVDQLAEYPLFIKGLITRHQGKIHESLSLFQQAGQINPRNVETIKQISRSLFLLGRHKAASEVLDEAIRLGFTEDWEIWHNKGMCLSQLKRLEDAKDALMRANSIQRHDCTFIQLGQILTQEEKYQEAIDVYLEALEFSPENPELLTTVGLLYLRTGENFRAFDFLGNSLTHDPRNSKTILAAGSIIQDHSDMDVALVKYRVAAVQTPNSAQLWNNIGMCFFGKQRHVAAIACLKKALYLDPFEWIISYNLGLVHLHTEQYASAFHYFSSSINLKPDFPSSYMFLSLLALTPTLISCCTSRQLAIALSRLDDYDNACAAYEKAIEMDSDFLFHLNYAVMLVNNGQVDKVRVTET